MLSIASEEKEGMKKKEEEEKEEGAGTGGGKRKVNCCMDVEREGERVKGEKRERDISVRRLSS